MRRWIGCVAWIGLACSVSAFGADERIYVTGPAAKAYRQAQELAGRGEFAAALERLNETLRLQPRFLLAYVNRAEILSGLGDAEKAVAEVTRALSIDPDFAPALAWRGDMNAQLCRTDPAIADYERAAPLFDGQGQRANAQRARERAQGWRDMKKDFKPTAIADEFSQQCQLCLVTPFVNSVVRRTGSDRAAFLRESRRRYELYQRMLAALDILGAYRQRFLARKEAIDYFPLVYFHVTRRELLNLVAGEFDYPEKKLEQIVSFFEAYEANRRAFECEWRARTGTMAPDLPAATDCGTGKVESHWQFAFDKVTVPALSSPPTPGSNYTRVTIPWWDSFEMFLSLGWRTSTAVTVLAISAGAHIQWDLPRTLRATVPAADAARLGTDFHRTDQVFASAVDCALGDLIGARAARAAHKLLGGTIEATILRDRKAAWDLAVGSKALRTGGSAPPRLDWAKLGARAQSACRELSIDVDGSPRWTR